MAVHGRVRVEAARLAAGEGRLMDEHTAEQLQEIREALLTLRAELVASP